MDFEAQRKLHSSRSAPSPANANWQYNSTLVATTIQNAPKATSRISRWSKKLKDSRQEPLTLGCAQWNALKSSGLPVEHGGSISYLHKPGGTSGYFDCLSFEIGTWRAADFDLTKPLIYYHLGEKPYIDYRFITETRRLVVHIPFLYIKQLSVNHESHGMSMLIELHRPPKFLTCNHNSAKLRVCDDFTPDEQASKEPLHVLKGDWAYMEHTLMQISQTFHTSLQLQSEEKSSLTPQYRTPNTLSLPSLSSCETICSESGLANNEPADGIIDHNGWNQYVKRNISDCLDLFTEITGGCDEAQRGNENNGFSLDTVPEGVPLVDPYTQAKLQEDTIVKQRIPSEFDSCNISAPLNRGGYSGDHEMLDIQSSTGVTLDSTNQSEYDMRTDSTKSSRSIFTLSSSNDEPTEIFQALVDMLVERVLVRFNEYRCLDPICCTGSSNDCSNSTSQSTSLKTVNSSLTSFSSKRRKSDDSEDDGSGYGDRNGGPPSSKRQARGTKVPRFYACPYTKYDPERYSERNHDESYRTCGSRKLTTIARVKQHLERTHKRPDFYCGRCYQDFKEREELDTHLQLDDRCERMRPRYQEKMNDKQWKAIKGSRLDNSSKSWYTIFQMLFADIPPPTSPYASTSNPAQLTFLVDFIQFVGPQELSNLIRERLEQPHSSIPNLSMQHVVVEAFETLLPVMAESIQQDFESAEAIREQASIHQPNHLGSIAPAGMTFSAPPAISPGLFQDSPLTRYSTSDSYSEKPLSLTDGYHLSMDDASCGSSMGTSDPSIELGVNYNAKITEDFGAVFQNVIWEEQASFDYTENRTPAL